MDMALPAITMDFAGTPTPPSGTMDTTLSPISMTLAATSDTGGSASMTLGPVTMAFAGGVNPAGALAMTLSPITIAFSTETIPFGEQVIRVEAESRAFRVIDEDPGLIEISRDQVTDL